MPWRVVISPSARRELRALQARDRAAISGAINRLAAEFGALDVTKLGGRGNEWRLRVGRWRVRLDLDNASGVINVLRISDRRDAYRD